MILVRRKDHWQKSKCSDNRPEPRVYIFDTDYDNNERSSVVGLGDQFLDLNGVHGGKHILEGQPRPISNR